MKKEKEEHAKESGGVDEGVWTLRDTFATAALTGLLAAETQDGEEPYQDPSSYYAARAYRLADAMIAERRKP